MWRGVPYSTMANWSGKHLVLSVLYLCHRMGIRYQWQYMWQWQKRVSPWWCSESSSRSCKNAGNALDFNFTLLCRGISFFSKWSDAHIFSMSLNVNMLSIIFLLEQVSSVRVCWTRMRHPVHAPKNCLQESPPQCRFALPVPASRFTSSREMTYDTNTNRNANAKKTHGKTYRAFFNCFARKMTKCQTLRKFWHIELFRWDFLCNQTLTTFRRGTVRKITL